MSRDSNLTGSLPSSVVKSKFALGDPVKLPKEIYAGAIQPRICGIEWGPDNWRLKADGWIYYIKLEEGRSWFTFTEEELVKWGN